MVQRFNPLTQQMEEAQAGALGIQPVAPNTEALSPHTARMVAPTTGGLFDPISQHLVGSRQMAAENERAAQQGQYNQAILDRQLGLDKANALKEQRKSAANTAWLSSWASDPKKAAWLKDRYGNMEEMIAAGNLEPAKILAHWNKEKTQSAIKASDTAKAVARGKAMWAAFEKTTPEAIHPSVREAVMLDPSNAEYYINLSRERAKLGGYGVADSFKDKSTFARQWNREGLDGFLTSTLDNNLPKGIDPVTLNNLRTDIREKVGNLAANAEGNPNLKEITRKVVADTAGSDGLGKKHPHYNITKAQVYSKSPEAQEAIDVYTDYVNANTMGSLSNVDLERTVRKMMLDDIDSQESSLGVLDRNAPSTFGALDAGAKSFIEGVGGGINDASQFFNNR